MENSLTILSSPQIKLARSINSRVSKEILICRSILSVSMKMKIFFLEDMKKYIDLLKYLVLLLNCIMGNGIKCSYRIKMRFINGCFERRRGIKKKCGDWGRQPD